MTRLTRQSNATLWFVPILAAALVAGCGGENASMDGAMEETTNETAAAEAATEPMDADMGTEATSESGETRMDGPPTSAMTESTSETNMQDTDEEAESAEPMTSGEPLPGSGVPVWEEGAVGQLVPGLDGAEYDAYAPELIGEVQQALSEEGIYTGPVNQVLDQPTMNAIGEFQEANGIHVSGVPSPLTREALLEDNG